MARKKLIRESKQRTPNLRILIITEGEKTEPNYFNGLKRYYRIKTAKIVITGKCPSDPNLIVNEAQKMYKKSYNERNEYDYIYCVFDKDNPEKYNAAM